MLSKGGKVYKPKNSFILENSISSRLPILQFYDSYFYSTTNHEILQISNHNLLCSLDPPNQGWFYGSCFIYRVCQEIGKEKEVC